MRTKTGMEFFAKAVVLATGTFLRGLLYIGDKRVKGGRMKQPILAGQLYKADGTIRSVEPYDDKGTTGITAVDRKSVV